MTFWEGAGVMPFILQAMCLLCTLTGAKGLLCRVVLAPEGKAHPIHSQP